MLIKDFDSLKKFFRKIKRHIFGAGVYAFNRLGLEDFIPDYRILSLYFSEETKLIQEDIPVFCLEKKIKKRLQPRNSSTLLSHLKTQNYISEFQEPLILLYKSSKRIEKVARRCQFEPAISPYRFGKQLFENKIKFRKILHKIKVQPTPGKILSSSLIHSLRFSELEKEFGLPFVLQHPKKGGGKGTFFIRNENDFRRAIESVEENPVEKIIVTKFINGPSPSITGCVTKFGVLSTRPQYQICDIPILYSRPVGSGLFCGHDWSAANFSKSILSQAKEIVEKVGHYFKKLDYRGIFGIDFVQDPKEEKLYVTECNPRLLGSMPTLTMVELDKGIPPIISFHILEYLKIPYDINIKKILELLWQKREGAQMILHSPLKNETIQKGKVQPGIYITATSKRQIARSKLEFLRAGYKFSHLENEDEFLLTEGLQKKGAKIGPYQRLTRILSQKRVLDDSLKDITPETKDFIRSLLKKFKITKDL